jgi:hypothetical protein
VEHRKTPVTKALTLPGWIIALSTLVCLAAASYFAFLLVNGDSPEPPARPAATATTTAPATRTPTTAAPTTEVPTTEPTTAATPSPKPTAVPALRNIPVGIFNNTRTAGLADRVAAKARAAGWSVAGVGNWRGSIPETTVYYPPGFAKQAQTLARDLDFSRVRPLVAPMRSDRLTVILSGPQ